MRSPGFTVGIVGQALRLPRQLFLAEASGALAYNVRFVAATCDNRKILWKKCDGHRPPLQSFVS
jgi:hypothetical protein